MFPAREPGWLGGLFASSGAAVVLVEPAIGAASGSSPVWLDTESWAWWALFGALVAFALVLWVLRAVGYRKLNRLWQCVVASVLAHVALTAGMSLVAISRPVLTLLGRRGAEDASVNLVIGHEAQLRTQIRYQLTELPLADPSLASLMRAAVETIQAPPVKPTELGAPPVRVTEADLAAEPAPPSAVPPAVADQLDLRPRPAEQQAPTIPEGHRPVARQEPPARAEADRPVAFRPAASRPEDAGPAWRAALASVPAAELAAGSIAAAAARHLSPLPQPGEPSPVAPARADEPAIEIAGPASALRVGEDSPAPLGEAARFATPRLPAGPADPNERPLSLPPEYLPRPVEVNVESIAIGPPAAAAGAPTEAIVAPRRLVDGPGTAPGPASPVRPSGALPAWPDLAAAGMLQRRATGERREPGAAAPPSASVPLSAAEAMGASLSAHVVAELRPPVAEASSLEAVALAPALEPLGSLAPRKIRVVAPIEHRTPQRRKELLERMGGSRISEDAVRRGLAYLARSQEPEGRWTFLGDDAPPRGQRPANKDDMGLTGLAVLCFLAADCRPDEIHEYRKCVADALEYLRGRQKGDGDLRGEGDMYSHGIATLALGEAAAMTGDARYGQAATRGASFIVAAQNPMTGGWRYEPRQGGDTSVLGWQVMALHSVTRLGVGIPEATRRGALLWLARVSRGRHGMLAGYQDANPTRTMTAEVLFVRLLLGQKLTREQTAEAAEYLQPPDSLELPSFYGWYYGSLALMQLQDETWRKWNEAVRDRLISTQQRGGEMDGSWDHRQSQWGVERGGRIYATALGTLTLEVYYRYLPMLVDNRVFEEAKP